VLPAPSAAASFARLLWGLFGRCFACCTYKRMSSSWLDERRIGDACICTGFIVGVSNIRSQCYDIWTLLSGLSSSADVGAALGRPSRQRQSPLHPESRPRMATPQAPAPPPLAATCRVEASRPARWHGAGTLNFSTHRGDNPRQGFPY